MLFNVDMRMRVLRGFKIKFFCFCFLLDFGVLEICVGCDTPRQQKYERNGPHKKVL
jgi:hypothetical protein